MWRNCRTNKSYLLSSQNRNEGRGVVGIVGIVGIVQRRFQVLITILFLMEVRAVEYIY